jgi:hypothetical protein
MFRSLGVATSISDINKPSATDAKCALQMMMMMMKLRLFKQAYPRVAKMLRED